MRSSSILLIALAMGFAALGTGSARADAPAALVLNQPVVSHTIGADASWRLDAVSGDRFEIDAQNTGATAIELCLLDPYWWPTAPAGAACAGGQAEIAPGASAEVTMSSLQQGPFQVAVRGRSCAPALDCHDSLSYTLHVARVVAGPGHGPIVAIGDSLLADAATSRNASSCARSAHAFVLGAATRNLACAGVTIGSLLDPASPATDEIAALRRVAAHGRVGALVVSVGGDEADLGGVQAACHADVSTSEHLCVGAIDDATARVNGARGQVGKLFRALRRAAPGARLYSVGYPPLIGATFRPCEHADAAEVALVRLSTALDGIQLAAHQAGALMVSQFGRDGSVACDGRTSVLSGFRPSALAHGAWLGGWLVKPLEASVFAEILRQEMLLPDRGLVRGSKSPDGLSAPSSWRAQDLSRGVRLDAYPGYTQGTYNRLTVSIRDGSAGAGCDAIASTTSLGPGTQTLTVGADAPCGLASAVVTVRAVVSRETFAATLVAPDGTVLLDAPLQVASMVVV